MQLQWFPSGSQGGTGLEGESITTKELLAIVLACAVWGKNWAGQVVKVHCDNSGAVSVVNSGYSRVPQMMHLLRCLFFIQAH